MQEIWNTLLYQPLLNSLMFFYSLFGNLGVAIIILTIVLYVVLIPLNLPSMKAAKKMAEIAPEIAKLKKRHGDNKQAFAKAQMDLYKQYKINPAAGCLPLIIQMVVLFTLYQAFIQVLKPDGVEVINKLNEILYPFLQLPQETKINLSFLYLDLSKPDLIHIPNFPPLPGIFLILAAIAQFASSKMMAPVVKKEGQVAKKTKETTDDFAAAMQSQMLYLFPLMTIFIGFSFPSGVAIYWFLFSFLRIIQQYFTSGWGGLSPFFEKLGIMQKRN